MFSEKDFERLWFLYKTEGEPKGVSINSFCISNNIPYTAFYDWFKKTQKKVVPVEVEGIPEELVQASNGEQDVTKEKPKRISPNKGNIMVLKTVDIRSPKTVISVHFSYSLPMAMQIY
ncbi:hypothetical protein QVN91_01880 [Bacteroides caecigallinarum]|nr:hypothetical protein [Bacteroides caecigallinarum]